MYIVTIKNGEVETQIHGEKRKLKNGNVVKGINVIDSFSFSILPSNAGFNLINDFQTLVHVYNTNKNRDEFFGRVLYSESSMEESGLIYKNVVCESYLGFLCDSQQSYVEEKNWTVRELLQHIIDAHNEQVEEYKRFTLGNVTVTDPNDNLYVGIQRENSWNTIAEKLIEKLGGEIAFRVVDGVNYLDYVEKIGTTLSTSIELSKNMKSITRENNPLNYVSRVIPLGAKIKTTDEEGNETETEERVDITSVNNGLNYIESTEARNAYGIRYATVIFEDVTTASALFAKGQEHLVKNNKVQIKYSINALDLSLIGLDINDFDVCNYHPIKNKLLGIDDTARIIKKNIDVCNPTSSSIEFGDNFKTLSDINFERDNAIKDAVTRIESAKNELKEFVGRHDEGLTNEMKSIVYENNTTMVNDFESILLSALESYTATGDFESFKQSIQSELKLIAEQMTLKFTEATQNIENVNGTLQEQLNTITKYFTFNINGLTIGQIDNPYKVIIDNDRYSMTVNDVEVMWIADGKVYTPEIEVSRAFKLFGYLIDQDANGNVNCSYVGGE